MQRMFTHSPPPLWRFLRRLGAGLHTVLEQPIAAKEVELQIMEEEHERYPDWEPHSAHYEETKALAERERSEWEIADTIIVPSKFVEDSLEQVGISAGRCVIVPYGVSDKFSQIEHHNHEGPLRVLSVGGMQLRKGSQYTCEAAKILGSNFVFRFVGECLVPDLARRDFGASVRIVGHVPRSEVSAHFEWADVFLLPSLCEGMATVLIEALAAGLPVITTANSGLEVRDGVDGFVVPIRNSNAIAERLGQLASDPCLLAQMSQNARRDRRSLPSTPTVTDSIVRWQAKHRRWDIAIPNYLCNMLINVTLRRMTPYRTSRGH